MTPLAAETTRQQRGRDRPLVLPVGSCEQHGGHLPLGTDTFIAESVAKNLVTRLGERAVLGPTQAIGASGEHNDFPGTLSLGNEVLAQLVVELVRSADHFVGTVIVNGHGGNLAALTEARNLLSAEGRHLLVIPCAVPSADLHAGRTETSAMLALAPELVDLRFAEPGNCSSFAELEADLRMGGIAAVAPNGVLGDPTGATAAEGELILNEMLARAEMILATWVDGGASE